MTQSAVAPTEAPARADPGHDTPISPLTLPSHPLSPLVIVATSFAVLAVAAGMRGGAALLHVDEPVERFVVGNRMGWLTTVFRSASFMGSTYFVLIGGAVLAAVAALRCWPLAALVVVATVGRPFIEYAMKRIVGRERPTLDQMVNGVGPAFPSGHPMAGSMLWLLVPAVVSLYHPSRRLWSTLTAAAMAVVGLIALSRVYLGVHWLSDVVGGILFAAVLLTALDAGFRWLHGRRGGALLQEAAR